MRIRKKQLDTLGHATLANRRRAKLLAERDNGYSVEDDPGSGTVRIRDAAGNTSQVHNKGDTAVVVSGEGRRFRFVNDQTGTLKEIEDPAGVQVSFDHDEEGLLRRVRREGNVAYSYSYDENGHVSSITGPDGAASHYRRNNSGKVKHATDRNGNSRHYEYDEDGLLSRMTSTGGAETCFQYDDWQSPSSIDLPTGVQLGFLYSPDGQLSAMDVDGSRYATYTHDDAMGTHEVRYADGTWVRLTYEGDRLVEAANEHGTLTLRYDERGNLISENFEGREVCFARDGIGALTGITLPTGEELAFDRDAEGRLSAVTDWNGGRYEIAYHAVGAPAEILYPNGLVQSMTANRMGLPVSLIVRRGASHKESIESCRWDYDVCDRVAAEDRNEETSRFSYDGEGRLTEVAASRPDRSARFELDGEGNRIRDGSGEYRYDEANQLLWFGSQTFAYDALGNTIRGSCPKGPASFTYNGRGQLLAVRLDSGVVHYAYDALGRRIRKQVNGRVTTYVWAGAQVVSETTTTDAGETTRKDFLYAGEHSTPLAMRIGKEVYYLHPGRRAEPLSMTTREGAIVWQAEYAAFGEAQPRINEIDQPFRLLGQYFDDETGLHYNFARYYNPILGRFLTQDPLRASCGSLNFYVYCDGDPLNKCDPTGEPIPLLIGIGILAAMAIGAGVNAYSEYKRQKEEYGEVRDTMSVVEEAGIGGAAGLAAAVAAIGVVAALTAAPVVAVAGAASALQVAFLAGVVAGVVGYCTDTGLSDKREATVEGAGWAAGIGGVLGAVFQLLARPVGSLLGRIFKRTPMPKTTPPKVDLPEHLAKKYDLTPGTDTGQPIKFGQKGASPTFGSKGRFKGADIDDIVAKLKSGELTPDDIPVEYIWVNGQKVVVNNRSLTALSKAGMKPTKSTDMTGKLPKDGPDCLESVLNRLEEMGGKPSNRMPVRSDPEDWTSAPREFVDLPE